MSTPEYLAAYKAWKDNNPGLAIFVDRYATLTMDLLVAGRKDESFVMLDNMHTVFFNMSEKEVRGALATVTAPPTTNKNINQN